MPSLTGCGTSPVGVGVGFPLTPPDIRSRVGGSAGWGSPRCTDCNKPELPLFHSCLDSVSSVVPVPGEAGGPRGDAEEDGVPSGPPSNNYSSPPSHAGDCAFTPGGCRFHCCQNGSGSKSDSSLKWTHWNLLGASPAFSPTPSPPCFLTHSSCFPGPSPFGPSTVTRPVGSAALAKLQGSCGRFCGWFERCPAASWALPPPL